MALPPWELESSTRLAATSIFEVWQERFRSPTTGRRHEMYVLNAGPWVNVVPLTQDLKVVMVRQFRAGSREIGLEIPGGLVEQGEDPRAAALRELREETGYTAQDARLLGRVRPNPAFLDNICHMYVAFGAAATTAQDLDPGEEIEVELVDLDRIPSLLLDGTIDHSLVLNAFHLLEARYPGGSFAASPRTPSADPQQSQNGSRRR